MKIVFIIIFISKECFEIIKRLVLFAASYGSILKNINIVVITSTVFMASFSWMAFFYVFPLFLRDLGASEADISHVYICISLAGSIFAFAGGYLADKFGRKRLITIISFLIPIFTITAAFSESWTLIAAMIVMGNLVTGLKMPVLNVIIAESVEKKDRGLAFGIYAFTIAASCAIGPGIGSLVPYSIENVKLIILLHSLIRILAALARYLFLKDTIKQESIKINFKDVAQSFNKPIILCFISSIFYTLLLNSTTNGPFISLFSKDILKIDARAIQMMFMTAGIVTMIFNIVNGKIVQKLGARNSVILGSMGFAVLILPWLYANGELQAILMYIPSSIFLSLIMVGQSTLLSDLTVEKTRSSIFGVFGTICGLTGSGALYIGYFLMLHYGMRAPFYGAIVFAILMGICLFPINTKISSEISSYDERTNKFPNIHKHPIEPVEI